MSRQLLAETVHQKRVTCLPSANRSSSLAKFSGLVEYLDRAPFEYQVVQLIRIDKMVIRRQDLVTDQLTSCLSGPDIP